MRMLQKLFYTFAFIAVAASQTQNDSNCAKLARVYESMCPNHDGNPILSSNPNEIGEGDTLSFTLEDTIALEVQKAFESHTHKFAEMEATLMAMDKKIAQLEKSSDFCPMKYDGKCFWIIPRYGRITLQQGRDICNAEGGHLANIYSEDHYYMLLGNLRMLASRDGVIYASLGMTYDQQTDTVSLSNGTAASFTKWAQSYPDHQLSSCCIVLKARSEWTSERQHMINADDSRRTKAVICEK